MLAHCLKQGGSRVERQSAYRYINWEIDVTVVAHGGRRPRHIRIGAGRGYDWQSRGTERRVDQHIATRQASFLFWSGRSFGHNHPSKG